jgi:hypothetical protein
MQSSINRWIKSCKPSIKNESFEWDKQTFLEWLFLKTINIPFIVIDKIRNVPHIKRYIDRESFRDYAVNTLIVFFIFFVISILIVWIPLIITGGYANFLFIYGLTLYLVLGSIAWTGLVYLSWNFKDLIRTKIVHLIRQDMNHLFKRYIGLIINGNCIEWPSGKSFRFYIRDLFVFSLILYAVILNYIQVFQIYSGFPVYHPNIFSIFHLLDFVTPVLFVFFVEFIILRISKNPDSTFF